MRRLLLVLFFVAIAFLTGCQARTNLDVRVNANGSGTIAVTVTLDKEAASANPNLAQQLRTGDLKTAGWNVSGPSTASNGDETIKASHSFANAAQANVLLGQVSDQGGAFQDFRITEQRSFAKIKVGFSGTVDLTKGISSFGSGRLATSVGSPLGFNPDEVQQSLGVDWAQSFPVEVTVHLPGGTRDYVPTPDDSGTWHLAYGHSTQLSAHSSGLNATPIVLLFLAVGFLIATAVVAIVWKSDVYKGRHRKKRGGVRAKDLLAQMEAHND